MKVLVCGSREYPLMRLVKERVDQLDVNDIVLVGGARGVDSVAEAAARERLLTVERYPALWEKHGKAAGYLRNIDMLRQHPDLVIAFHDGKSRGTMHTMREARARGIPIELWDKEGNVK